MNYEIVEPKLAAKYCVIWLHGLGADGHDFVDIVGHLNISLDHIRFIFPHADMMPITINGGMQMRGWYDIKSLDANSLNRVVDKEGIVSSIAKINTLIDLQVAKDIKSDNIILAGFSQGGVIATYTAITSDRKLGGLMALSTYLPAWEDFKADVTAINKNLPILVCHGTNDTILPEMLGKELSQSLSEQGFNNDYKSYNGMSHSVCPQEVTDISKFLAQIMKPKLTIASRESKLALWQTHFVRDTLQEKLGLGCEIVTMKTQGDIILDKPLNKIGGKALFMKELERSMQKGETDIAVHSLKDIPYELPQGFCLASFMPRADPRDAFVSNKFATIDELPQGAVVGTSSLRRKSQLINYRNDLVIKDLRGNVQTRLSKLDNGDYDAIILAGAGLLRLGLESRIAQYIPIEISLPAVGQGIVVIEALENKLDLITSLKKINNKTSSRVAATERAFNKELQGGCHVAIAAYATIATDDSITLQAMVASSDGKEILKMSNSGFDPIEVGSELAKEMISHGAYEILKR